MIRPLAGVCAATMLVLTPACSANSDQPRSGGAPAGGVPLSSCDAAAPTGQTTTLETKSSNGRTVEVRIPLLPEWGRPIRTGVAQPGDATPGLGEGARTDSSGAWVNAVAEIDFDAPAPVDREGSGLGPQPRQTPIAPESLGISIDDEQDGTVCGQPAHLKRQHPIGYDSRDPYTRAQLTITCSCGSDTPTSIVVKVKTGEQDSPAESRSARNEALPPHPSRFESDIASILDSVEVVWGSHE